jgi:hypothetical protein
MAALHPEGRPPEISELPFRIPGVCADNPQGLARNVPPVLVKIKPGATPVSQKQYFIPHKAWVKIQRHVDRLLKYGILHLCQESWKTPLLPIQKPGIEDFRPV